MPVLARLSHRGGIRRTPANLRASPTANSRGRGSWPRRPVSPNRLLLQNDAGQVHAVFLDGDDNFGRTSRRTRIGSYGYARCRPCSASSISSCSMPKMALKRWTTPSRSSVNPPGTMDTVNTSRLSADDAPVPIVNFAPGRGRGQPPQPIAVRQLRVLLTVDDLQLPHAAQEQGEDGMMHKQPHAPRASLQFANRPRFRFPPRPSLLSTPIRRHASQSVEAE